MTEILTESFCERCGTRYTFETVAPRQARLGGLKVLGKGLKTFVLSDDTSLDEAMATARSDEEREMTSRQLDAFHKTFNFCMNCRQYTCSNCWNPIEARCLSCSPRPDQVVGAPALQLGVPGGFDLSARESPAMAISGAPAEEVAWSDSVDLLRRLDMPEAAPAEQLAAATNGAEPDLEALLASRPEAAGLTLEPTDSELIGEPAAVEPESEPLAIEPESEPLAIEPVTEPPAIEPVTKPLRERPT